MIHIFNATIGFKVPLLILMIHVSYATISLSSLGKLGKMHIAHCALCVVNCAFCKISKPVSTEIESNYYFEWESYPGE